MTRLSLKRPITTLMVYSALALGGIVALFQLPVDMLPNRESNLVTVFVNVRGGMPPEDIEHLVTEPIENAMATMIGLKEITSVSRKDRATITIVFDETQNIKRATLDVSERVARIRGKLPREIEKPIVARYNENDHPVVILSATSSVKTPEVLREMVERDLKPQLSRLPGVANIEIGGGRQRKILVEFDKAKLNMHRLDILDVIRQLGENNLTLTSGGMDSARETRQVQIEGEFETLDDMRNLGIAITKEGSRIRLGDIAVVRDYYLEPDSYARVNNQPTVSIYVQKESGGNTVRVAKSVIETVNKYQKSLPSDMGIGITLDQSVAIDEAIGDVRTALLVGAFLTMFILWMYLRRIREVAVVVVAIPVAVLGTFFFMFLQALIAQRFQMGIPMTINVMSLLGIALGIGRMVDDSIVVFENIVRQRDVAMKTPGKTFNSVEAAITGAREMIVPVASSTLLMVVIFLPLILISAEVRQLYSDVAFTVIAALVVSLFVAMTVVPLLTSKALSRDPDKEQYQWEKKLVANWKKGLERLGQKPQPKAFRFGIFGIYGIGLVMFAVWLGFWTGPKFLLIGPLLAGGIALLNLTANGLFRGLVRRMAAFSIRHRAWVMAAILLSGAASVAVYVFGLDKEFMGNTQKDEFVIFVELPSGSKLDISDKVVASIEREINALPEIKGVVKTVAARVEGWSSKLYVTLVPVQERTRTVEDVIDTLRPIFEQKKIGDEYDAFVYFSEPQSSKELVIDVYGPDYLVLRDMAVDIAKQMEGIEGLVDVKLRYKPGRPQVAMNVDHNRASVFGLSSRQIADSMHAQVRGLRVTWFNTGEDHVETVGRLSEEDRRTVEQISDLNLISQGRKKVVVPIQQVVDFEYGLIPSEVWRKDKERYIQVSANRDKLPLSKAIELLKAKIKDIKVPVGYHYEFGGDYKKLRKSEREFSYAFIVMLALIYMILAIFFESYAQPILMLLTIPLAAAGSMPALWVTGTSVNVGVYIGLLLLGGTVVSNAVILIDRINNVIDSRGLLRSVMKAGVERARPIFMTSLTTIGAMLPLTLSRGQSSEIWAPLAITVVSGIAVSSVLTLMAVPAAYVILTNLKRRFTL